MTNAEAKPPPIWRAGGGGGPESLTEAGLTEEELKQGADRVCVCLKEGCRLMPRTLRQLQALLASGQHLLKERQPRQRQPPACIHKRHRGHAPPGHAHTHLQQMWQQPQQQRRRPEVTCHASNPRPF
eukprot:356073-Chlamydomonas_euryale.AAC.2